MGGRRGVFAVWGGCRGVFAVWGGRRGVFAVWGGRRGDFAVYMHRTSFHIRRLPDSRQKFFIAIPVQLFMSSSSSSNGLVYIFGNIIGFYGTDQTCIMPDDRSLYMLKAMVLAYSHSPVITLRTVDNVL